MIVWVFILFCLLYFSHVPEFCFGCFLFLLLTLYCQAVSHLWFRFFFVSRYLAVPLLGLFFCLFLSLLQFLFSCHLGYLVFCFVYKSDQPSPACRHILGVLLPDCLSSSSSSFRPLKTRSGDAKTPTSLLSHDTEAAG